jgi:hypothetical protein
MGPCLPLFERATISIVGLVAGAGKTQPPGASALDYLIGLAPVF